MRRRDRRALRARPAPQALPDAALATAASAAVDLLRRAVDVAAELGAPVVSLWSGAAPEATGAASAPGSGCSTGCERVLDARRAPRRHARLRARARDARRAARPTTRRSPSGSAHPPRARPHARHRPLRLPRADAGRRSASGAAAPTLVARPHRGHAPRRARAPDVRRGRARLRRRRSPRCTEIGYDGLVAVELSRHAHAAHETVPARDRGAARPRARGGDGVSDPTELSAALEERARPDGLAWLREASAAVAADPAAIRARFPMVGRKVGRGPLEPGADPADVHALDGRRRRARRCCSSRSATRAEDELARALPLRRRGRAARRAARAAVPAGRRPRASTSSTTRSAPTTRG